MAPQKGSHLKRRCSGSGASRAAAGQPGNPPSPGSWPSSSGHRQTETRPRGRSCRSLHFDEDGELDFQDEGGILPDAAVLQGPAVLKSVAGEEEPLVVNRDFLLGLESVFVT